MEMNNPPIPPFDKCHNMKKPIFEKEGEAVGWKRFRAVTFSRSDSNLPMV
jgi:hypothetical protein